MTDWYDEIATHQKRCNDRQGLPRRYAMTKKGGNKELTELIKE